MTSGEDIYEQITNKIITQLESGNLAWLKPWKDTAPTPPLRSNGLPYSGINVLALWAEAMDRGYSSPTWMTFQQAKELGGHVRKGEHGTQVVYANTYTKKEEDEKGEEVERAIPFLKSYTVFNVEQIEGLPQQYYAKPPTTASSNERVPHAEDWVRKTGAELVHGGNVAKYTPGTDRVHMPHFEAFSDSTSYYSTLAHELIHWTKHPTRLDRNFESKRFGDEGYAVEELVAELGSAFACASLGIASQPAENSAAYLASWLKVLKSDKHAIFTAASYAQKAVDMLNGKSRQAQDAETRLSTESEETQGRSQDRKQ